MNNKKIILYTLGGVVTVVLGYFLYKKITAPELVIGEFDDDDSPSPKPVNNKPKKKFPLKKGSRGAEVVALQKFLNEVGLGNLLGTFGKNKDGVDGIFGNATESAVKQQQSPFTNFQIMYPKAVFGQVSEDYYNMFIKGQYDK